MEARYSLQKKFQDILLQTRYCHHKYNIAIFCDGDFWHGKENPDIIKTHKKFWTEKIKRNIERDLENTIELRDNGWTVLRFWESDIQKNINYCINVITSKINIQKYYMQRRNISNDYKH